MSDEIRTFGVADIQAAIDREVAALPMDHKIAVVAYADFDGAKLGVVYRIADEWSFVGTLDKPFDGKLEGSAQLRWSK